MPNTPYENSFLENEIEDQFTSHLDLNPFATHRTGLVGVPGMEYVVNTYSATNGTEVVAEGAGNTKVITAGYTGNTYKILTLQNTFEYNDETLMKDPMVVETGVRHMSTDMFNTVNDMIYAEYLKGTQIHTATNFDFGAFANAQAMLNFENLDNAFMFGFLNAADEAKVRIQLAESLKFVEAFARRGYIGTVAGVNLYVKKNAAPGNIVIGTKSAVTVFDKTGVEVEQYTIGNRGAANAGIRKNSLISRKYLVAALTDDTGMVILSDGTALPAVMPLSVGGTTGEETPTAVATGKSKK